MQRPAIITTPMPTLEEVAKSLGMSKRRQESLLRIARRHGTFGKAAKKDEIARSGVFIKKTSVKKSKSR